MLFIASTTITRVNNLLIVFDGITPYARRIDKRVKVFLLDFEKLLDESIVKVSSALSEYREMNKKPGSITAILNCSKVP